MTRPEFLKLTEALDLEVTPTTVRDGVNGVNLATVVKTKEALAVPLAALTEAHAEVMASVPPVDPEMPLTAVEEDAIKRTLADASVLETGNWRHGINDVRLQRFNGWPGINELRYWIARCDEIIERETRLREMAWPAPFRYIGRPGAMVFEGRRLRRGEVVNLVSRSQWEAFKDRFSPIDTEVAEEATT